MQLGGTDLRVGLDIQMELPLGIWKCGEVGVSGLALQRCQVRQETLRMDINSERDIFKQKTTNNTHGTALFRL